MTSKHLVAALIAVAGLTACTSQPPSNPSTPAYTETTVTLNQGTQWQLQGTVTMPRGAGPFPGVVLVQGSGPSDRDETVYNNKPFRDIADALATAGIAVLRYDKRTYIYQAQMAADIADVTVEQETIQDAIAAATLLRAQPGVDPARVFLLGHSEGGMLAPRIDAEGGGFAGLVIMAGSPRSLQDVMISQIEAAIPALPDAQKQAGQQQLDALVAQFDALASMTDDQARQMTIGGTSGYYFKEMDEHPAAGYLANLTKPLLILQGDKDFQISPSADYGAYQTLLAGRTNVTFKLYAGLNHLFMKSTTGTADEYKTPGTVDATVLEDIANWMGAN